MEHSANERFAAVTGIATTALRMLNTLSSTSAQPSSL